MSFRASILALVPAMAVVAVSAPSGAADGGIEWQRVSSATDDLPTPGAANMQTGAVVGDFDGDGINDFIISCRGKAPALIWYRRTNKGWDRFVIEKQLLPIEAGGAVHDIDGDGDRDIVFGGDYQGSDVWWWENPAPAFDITTSWRRRLVKSGGKTQHHDQVFGDLLGTGKPQLAFWNQNAKTIFLAEIPADVRNVKSWPLTAIYTGSGGEEGRDTFKYPEGISAFDVDADGKLELLAGNMILKHMGDKKFRATRIADVGGLIFAGYFKAGRYPQIVISPGDGIGPVRIYECTGDPASSRDWIGRDLISRQLIHGHSLQLADIDRDGNLDIFCAEMAKWHERQAEPDHAGATAWVLYGDGRGGFRTTELVRGHGWHEARVADLDGDGDMDILNKPYNWETPRVDVWLNGG